MEVSLKSFPKKKEVKDTENVGETKKFKEWIQKVRRVHKSHRGKKERMWRASV